ncbi:hypothetical protein SMICM17S_03818 [Streptomyces microflavus]
MTPPLRVAPVLRPPLRVAPVQPRAARAPAWWCWAGTTARRAEDGTGSGSPSVSPRKTRRTTRSAAFPSSYGQNRARNAARSCAEREPRQWSVAKMSNSSSWLRATTPGGNAVMSK